MKTIKQLADELGVSKDKVKYRVGNLPGNCVVKVGKITYLTDEGIAIIKEKLVGKTEDFTRVKSGELPGKLPTEVSTMFSMLQEELVAKNQQLEVKDKQIDDLNARLAESNANWQAAQNLLNTEMALHSGTMAELKALQVPGEPPPAPSELVEVPVDEQSVPPIAEVPPEPRPVQPWEKYIYKPNIPIDPERGAAERSTSGYIPPSVFENEVEPPPEPTVEPPKQGFFARLFGKK